MKTIEIIKPDDWHVHFRDNEMLKAVVPETTRHFSRAMIMPNLVPPVLLGKDALAYKERILAAIPLKDLFTPLMTIYLTENTNIKDIEESYKNGSIFAAKLYPAGATTNSESGVKNIDEIEAILETMSRIGMPLLIHGEVTNKEIDIFDREKIFIEKILDPICIKFPNLKITLEHITTKEAVLYVKNSNSNLSATITPHHLSLNRNAIFAGGINPHYYCLPILKKENHRLNLIEAATSGNRKFFLGTDTAPHLQKTKENACGCAGVFNSTHCMSILAQIFDDNNSLDNLEKFVSINGANHYNLPINKDKIIMTKAEKPIVIEEKLNIGDDDLIIFNPKFPIFWETKLLN